MSYHFSLVVSSMSFPSSTFSPVITKLPICFFDMSQHFLAFSTRASDATVLISFQLCDLLIKFLVFTFICFLINALNFSHPLSRSHFALTVVGICKTLKVWSRVLLLSIFCLFKKIKIIIIKKKLKKPLIPHQHVVNFQRKCGIKSQAGRSVKYLWALPLLLGKRAMSSESCCFLLRYATSCRSPLAKEKGVQAFPSA